MLETLAVLPIAFWAALLLLVGGGLLAVSWIRTGIGFPVLAVLGTVGVWYIGDAFYNDYKGHHMQLFTASVLVAAWWQVAVFVAVFLIFTPVLHRRVNGRYLAQGSQISIMLRRGTDQPSFQYQLQLFFDACLITWLFLASVAIARLGDKAWYYFFPFLGNLVDPWERGRIGTGFDALLSLANYLQILLAGVFGVVLALGRRPRVWLLALVGCIFTWPYYFFGRTRSAMLAVAVPAILAWVFLRLRGGVWRKVAVLAVCFLIMNAWFKFIIANRTDMTIASAFNENGFNLQKSEGAHHEGLNMFEELCWINTFIKQGTYTPNWGQRYFAEAVNPIPRFLWPNKPLIGIDYAIARGQGGSGNDAEANVNATVSTGMIGQGVVNFGRLIGPSFAALLLSLWAVILARLDLQGQKVGRIPLYGLGLILTFNLGRDVTFLTLNTFMFGGLIMFGLDYFFKNSINPNQAVAQMDPSRVPRRQESVTSHKKLGPSHYSVTTPRPEN